MDVAQTESLTDTKKKGVVSGREARKKARSKQAKATQKVVKTKELLASLKHLVDRGVMSNEEYETKKAEILAAKAKAKAQAVFNSYDEDKSGTIDVGELQKLVFELGEVMSKKEVTDLLTTIKGSEGAPADLKALAVTFDEFFAWWSGRGKANEQNEQNEKSRLLSLKLSSQAYKKKIEKQLKGMQQATGSGEGTIKISINLNIGEIVSVTDSIKISTLTEGADELRRAVGSDNPLIPVATALFRILPTVLPVEEERMLGVLNRIVGVTNAKASTKVKQAASGSVSSVHEGDEKYLKFEAVAPVAKKIDYALMEPLLAAIDNVSVQVDLDSQNLAAKGSLKATMNCSVIDACSKMLGKDADDFALIFDALKNLEEFECELNTTNWVPILSETFGDRTVLQTFAKECGVKVKEESSSSSSDSDSGTEDSDEQKKPLPNYSNMNRYWFQGRVTDDLTKKGDKKRGSDDSDVVKKATEMETSKMFLRVISGALAWDEAAFEGANMIALRLMRSYSKEITGLSDKRFYKSMLGTKTTPYLGAEPFLANAVEPTSLFVAFGKLLVKAEFNFPNLLHRLRNPVAERAHHYHSKRYEHILSEAYRTGKASDFSVKVGSKIFKLHKPLLAARCPQILDTLPADLDQAAFEIVVKYLYSDQLPESFEGLLEALDAAKDLKFTSMIDTVHRQLYLSTTQANVYHRLLTAVKEKADDYIVNWLIYYAVRWEVPYSGPKPTPHQKMCLKNGRLASWAVTQDQMEEAGLHRRISEQRTHLTLPRPILPIPRANLGSALAALRAGAHADRKILINLKWFPVHNFILGNNWPQFNKIVEKNEFINVTAQQFEAFLDYQYLGDEDAFNWSGTKDKRRLGLCNVFLAESKWFDKFFVNMLNRQTNVLASTYKDMSSDKQKGFESIGFLTGNEQYLSTLIALNRGSTELNEKTYLAFRFSAESERESRRSNHLLFLALQK